MRGKICFVTTSMGRLEHVKKTLPALMSQPESSVILVDYSCPENSGNWAEENFPDCQVVRVHNEQFFHAAKARNASMSIIKDASDVEWLCFVDVDTILSKDFSVKVQPILEKNRFITAYNIYNKVKGLGGLLIVHKSDFLAVGGYDEEINGYGTNASEMRLRLYFHGLSYKILPENLAVHIDHNHSGAYSKYSENNNISLYRNTKRLLKKIKGWERETGMKVPAELYNKNRIRQIESTLPFGNFPHIWLKVFLRKVMIKLKIIAFSK